MVVCRVQFIVRSVLAMQFIRTELGTVGSGGLELASTGEQRRTHKITWNGSEVSERDDVISEFDSIFRGLAQMSLGSQCRAAEGTGRLC
jgi:hypothetical protein